MSIAGLTPIPAATIAQFEARHHLQLPGSYKGFLQTAGAGSPEPNCYLDPSSAQCFFLALIFDPAEDRMAEQCFAFPPPADTGFVTVGTNAGGDYFLLSLETGEVFYWDHELHNELIDRDEVVWLAPSLPALVDALSSGPAGEPEAVD